MKFDPKLLLNPKTANVAPKRDEEAEEGPTEPNVTSMLEGMHNVFKRQDPPRKRPRVDDRKDHSKSTFSGSSGGVISDYLKNAKMQDEDISVDDKAKSDDKDVGSADANEGQANNQKGFQATGRGSQVSDCGKQASDGSSEDARETGARKETIVPEVVDLIESDEEDVDGSKTVEGPVDLTQDDIEESPTVCLGKIQAKINCHQVPAPSSKAVSFTDKIWPSIKCTLHRYAGKDLNIHVKDVRSNDFGMVDLRTANGLVPIMNTKIFKLRTEARMPTRRRKPYELPGSHCSEVIPLAIILYAPRKFADSIGSFLLVRKIDLTHPGSYAYGELYNPQDPDSNSKVTRKAGTQSYGSGNNSVRTAEEMQSDLNELFGSMKNTDDLPEAEPSSIVQKTLYPHQKQALWFLKQHEDPTYDRNVSGDPGSQDEQSDRNPLWKMETAPNGRKIWRSQVTDQQISNEPKPIRGGILADDMGLGKTLSMLSLIASTLDEAAAWAAGGSLDNHSRVAATLLLCPLSVMYNWDQQIKEHLESSRFTHLVYHGSSRQSTVQGFHQTNVVITTYQIVSNELYSRSEQTRKHSPFARFEFFRVVLDEAHVIRHQATQISKACCELDSPYRWALSGTPIQNRIQDLQSLLKFLRIQPFEDSANFSQYVLSPFKNADPTIVQKLQFLVSSITLRRGKERLKLPQKVDRTVKLDFSHDERKVYSVYQREGKNKVKALTFNNKLSGKTYHNVLRTILKLRLVSAHGKELLNDDDLTALEGLSNNTAIDVDIENGRPAISDRHAYEMLTLLEETGSDTCSQCSRRLRIRETEAAMVLGYILPCFQLICNDCIDQFKIEVTANQKDERFECPFCGSWQRAAFFQLTEEGRDRAEEAKENLKKNPRKAKLISTYQGPHTKTTELVKLLNESRRQSQTEPDEAPIKSVIFSGWTTHLDLIQLHLDEQGFKFVRLDGKMSKKQRVQSLTALENDDSVEGILVSIGAGGLGLNLTAASRVYMMEPQFNPAAESQALDRVHRLGQERDVICTRFIMKDSIEEQIQLLQKKKQELAELGLGRGKMDRAEAAKQKLEDLKSLFR